MLFFIIFFIFLCTRLRLDTVYLSISKQFWFIHTRKASKDCVKCSINCTAIWMALLRLLQAMLMYVNIFLHSIVLCVKWLKIITIHDSFRMSIFRALVSANLNIIHMFTTSWTSIWWNRKFKKISIKYHVNKQIQTTKAKRDGDEYTNYESNKLNREKYTIIHNNKSPSLQQQQQQQKKTKTKTTETNINDETVINWSAKRILLEIKMKKFSSKAKWITKKKTVKSNNALQNWFIAISQEHLCGVGVCVCAGATKLSVSPGQIHLYLQNEPIKIY